MSKFRVFSHSYFSVEGNGCINCCSFRKVSKCYLGKGFVKMSAIIFLEGNKSILFPLSCKCFISWNFTSICFVLARTFSFLLSFQAEILSSHTAIKSCCGNSKSFSMFNSHITFCVAVDAEIFSTPVKEERRNFVFLIGMI